MEPLRYGYVYFGPLLFSIAAFALAFVGTSCRYVEFASLDPLPSTDPAANEDASPLIVQFGLWHFTSFAVTWQGEQETGHGSCREYVSFEAMIDASWRAARGCNLVAVVLGGSAIFLHLFRGCLSTRRTAGTRRACVAGYLACCLCSGLSLLMLRSNACHDNEVIKGAQETRPVEFQDACSISTGGKASIAATALWAAAAAGTALLHPPENKPGADEGLDEPLVNEGGRR